MNRRQFLRGAGASLTTAFTGIISGGIVGTVYHAVDKGNRWTEEKHPELDDTGVKDMRLKKAVGWGVISGAYGAWLTRDID